LNQNILFQEEDEEENEKLKQIINLIKTIFAHVAIEKITQSVFRGKNFQKSLLLVE
jgi:hypothetical protein